MIGQSLEQIRKDLRLMPTPALVQYKQNPSKQAIEGIPMDMLAGLELSRRAELQQAQMARMAPSAQMPTVVDQQAMGLMGMAQQPAVNPAMPGQAPQFAAQQAPAPQQATQQPMQAPEQPQGAQMPMQPTQQQPKKMAVGGIVTLGDQMDANDQSTNYPTPYPPGQPVMMMAGGGIVAFRDNKDQPVDANMPASDDRSQFRKDIGSFIDSLSETPEQAQWRKFVDERRRAGAPIQYLLSPAEEYQRNKAVSSFLNDNPEAFKDPAARASFMKDPQGFITSYKKPEPATTTTTAPTTTTTGPVTPNDIQITQTGGGGLDINKLMSQFRANTGGSGGVTKLKLPPRSEEEQAAIDEANKVLADVKALQSPEIPEAERARMIEEQFKKNQEASKPYYDRATQMLAEERESNRARREDAASNARLRLGLGLLGSRAPTFGEGLKEAGLPALDAFERSEELLAQADKANRQAEMDLMRAKLADEKGDRKSAQEYFDSYQRNKREAYAAQVSSMNLRVQAAKVPADIANREERLGAQVALANERIASQAQIAGLRNQLGLMNLAARLQGQAPKPLTVSEKLSLDKRAREIFDNPGSPEFVQYVGKYYKGGAQQLAADLKGGRIKPDDAGFRSIINQGRRDFINGMVQGTQRSQGPIPFDQATFDLGME